MMFKEHEKYMAQALELAKLGFRGANPLVGAVIVDNTGAVVATGHHRGAGTLHAEAEALTKLSEEIDPATLTLYVTLEPCTHFGRTNPCARAVVESGIKKVVMASYDSSKKARGGKKELEAAGIEVIAGVLEDKAIELNERWFMTQKAERPFVTVKFAQTLDGKIAAIDGSSKWISSEGSRDDVHRDRARTDAMIVGTGTALKDNPRLTARIPGAKQPLAVVIGKRELPETAKVRQSPGGFHQFKTHNIVEVLEELAAADIEQVIVEGGSGLLAEFFKADLVDQVVCYLAPKILGDGINAIGSLEIQNISQALELVYDPISTPEIMGDDIKLQLIPRKKA
ncbi:MAG: bifunctional diaminohydroxyphosphoribosylaminopyrimidine deaminase/5-amino-6-(5-phosphoribosylamino)uracil reductase RibD [Micrococcaceae bacterium]